MKCITYGSVFSGIEAATVAWKSLGFKASWFSEIDLFPSAVLDYHYPSIKNLGDMTKIAQMILDGEVEAPEILVGGSPCQAFSVAGNRLSLDDDRGLLTIKYVELANAIDVVRQRDGKSECVIVWENVPGVLNTRDNAFGCFLGELTGGGSELKPSGKRWTNAGCVFGPQRAAAWRILDAQYFGLAQRRKRVFLVASARKNFNPSEILFEFDSLRRDIAPSRGEREKSTRDIKTSIDKPIKQITYERQSFHEFKESDVSSTIIKGGSEGEYSIVCEDLAPTLTRGFGDRGYDVDQIAGGGYEISIAGNTIGRKPENGGNGNGYDETDVSYTLTTVDVHAVCQGTQDPCINNNLAHSLGRNNGQENVILDYRVRKLTPVECERLQGFPDVKKSAIINIVNNEIESICYLDLQKSNVNAGTRCLRLQSNVLNAGEEKSKYRARSAEQSLSAPQAELKKHAQVTVLINLEQGILQILNQKRPILNVRIAEKQSLCPLHIQPEDFVQLSVAMLSELEKKAQTGKGGTRQNIISFIAQKSGRKLAGGFGLETEEYAKDVEKLTKEVKSYMKFTTSGAGLNFQSSEQKLAILFYCVTSAINLYIQEKTSLGNSYALKIETTIGYTTIPWRGKPAEDCPDGHRYKALGNSMAVPVMKWIGSRIADCLLRI